MSKKRIIKKLSYLGWYQTDYDENCFRYYDTNRYVDIDYPYIDIYTYNCGTKYKGYIESKAFLLFAKLLKKYHY